MKKYKHAAPLIALLLFTIGALFLNTQPEIQLSPGQPISPPMMIPAIFLVASIALFVVLLIRNKNVK
jgi:hypothetical protein